MIKQVALGGSRNLHPKYFNFREIEAFIRETVSSIAAPNHQIELHIGDCVGFDDWACQTFLDFPIAQHRIVPGCSLSADIITRNNLRIKSYTPWSLDWQLIPALRTRSNKCFANRDYGIIVRRKGEQEKGCTLQRLICLKYNVPCEVLEVTKNGKIDWATSEIDLKRVHIPSF